MVYICTCCGCRCGFNSIHIVQILEKEAYLYFFIYLLFIFSYNPAQFPLTLVLQAFFNVE